jgi:hypothetical protein
MAALTANTSTVQILSESCDHIMVRLLMHQVTAGDANSVLVVNADSLTHRTQILTINPAVRFPPGVEITGNDSLASAYVCYNIDANNIVVTLQDSANATGFDTNDHIVGNREGTGNTSYTHETSVGANVTAVVSPPRKLTIDSLLWSIQGGSIGGAGSEAKVGIEFANSSAFYTAITLTGDGYYGRNDLDAPLTPDPLPNFNGNIYVSTYGVAALGGYSIVLSCRKVQGYAQAPVY